VVPVSISGWFWTEVEPEDDPESLLIVGGERPRGNRPQRPVGESE
jgi:hypothetical protein